MTAAHMQLLTEPVPPTLYEAPPAMHRTSFAVRPGDVTLAASAWGGLARPTVVLVHGYPYRANFIRCLCMPRKRYAHAPVQVIVPTLDKYVSPALSEDLSRWVPKYWRRELTARHQVPLTRVIARISMMPR